MQKFFLFLIFCNDLNLNIGKRWTQQEKNCLGGQYYEMSHPSVQVGKFSQISEFWKSEVIFDWQNYFKGQIMVRNDKYKHIVSKWESIQVLRSINYGFVKFNPNGYFQKRINVQHVFQID